MLANMFNSLVEHGEIQTTVEKAKALRRFADRMITLGKKGDLHHRRLAVSRAKNKTAVKALFDEIAPKFAERKGGYTRIIKLGKKRLGDAADLCLVQWVGEVFEAAKQAGQAEKKAKTEARKAKAEEKAAAAAAKTAEAEKTEKKTE
jgi:large subunit ribosomal protein L17